ncbi:MAG: bacterial Ig-like domain-containing protein [Treponema sp.]|jgi:hypothetical protein|nr:bacterial Ig-like domain-containing protein [Treponema sp.]
MESEALGLTGLVVTGTYSDGTTKMETMSASNVTGYDADHVGQQTLIVTVHGKTVDFSVTVNDVADCLAKTDGRATVDDPVQLSINADLADDGWEALLAVIRVPGKYAVLDLSAVQWAGLSFTRDRSRGRG